MRILLIGSGGREHALGRKLKLDDPTVDLHSAPGNPGLAELGVCHEVGAGDVAGLVALAEELTPDLVLVGPEDPLTKGLADQLQAKAIDVFGPDQYGAQLEASKAFAKEIMAEAGVPTGR
ncbi:MAG: phosphoribosylamine--glycine ligase, partial [Pseudomonadota bacterium]